MAGHLRWVERLRWGAWVALLLSVPVTSFPFFPSFVGLGETLVRPLALYPLGLLVLLDLVPYLVRGGRLPRLVLPLAAFALVALLATGLSLLEPALPVRHQLPLTRGLRAIVTLALGGGFFLVTLRMASRSSGLEASVRWMLVGMGLAGVWGLLQASRLLVRWPYYAPLNTVQRLFSTRDMHLYRVTGLSYEPSWFADQLVTLALPFLLAGLLSGHRLFRGRWGRVAEWGLFALFVFNLIMTYSRGGVVAFALSAGVGLAFLLGSRWKSAIRWLLGLAPTGDRVRNRWLHAVLRLASVTAAVVALVVGLGWLLSRSGYFALLWTRLERIGNLTSYIIAVGGGTRLAMASASWQGFLQRPWFGLGLGQSGFYILDHLPGWSLDRIEEITLLLSPTTYSLPNPKNLWIRLLVETGLVGTLLFLVFLGLLFAGTLALLRSADRRARCLGGAGLMAWLAITVSGFSLDSFALPTMWIALGFVSAAIWMFIEAQPNDVPI
jgi:O-antigen ligase